MTKNILLTIVLLFLLILMIICFSYNINFIWGFIHNNFTDLHQWTSNHQILASVIFFLAYIFICLFSLPIATLVTVSGVSLLGWVALPLTILGASIGATLFFVYSHKIVTNITKKKTFLIIDKIRLEFNKSPFRWLLILRLLPILPFFICNFIPVILGMKKTSFFFATLIGVIPASFIYISLGIGTKDIFYSDKLPTFNLLINKSLYLPLFALIIILIISIIFKKKTNLIS